METGSGSSWVSGGFGRGGSDGSDDDFGSFESGLRRLFFFNAIFLDLGKIVFKLLLSLFSLVPSRFLLNLTIPDLFLLSYINFFSFSASPETQNEPP